MTKQRLVVGITGSSGAILGIRLLEALQPTSIETHLIISQSARLTIAQETSWKIEDVLALAGTHYQPGDLAAPLASGSFATLGMVVIPCSMKSLSAIANSYSSDLLTRAADVTLKEGRPLLLVVREAPLHSGHIRLMDLAARSGAVIFPPVPAFYAHPQHVDEIVDNIVGRVLQRMGIENDLYMHWGEQKSHEQQDDDAPWSLPSMMLATTGTDGSPHAALVDFAASEDHQEIYFFCAQDSQQSLDLTHNPRAAVVIQAQAGRHETGGVQLHGDARAVSPGQEWQNAWQRYLVKFPFASDMREAFERGVFYNFRPDWAHSINHRHGFEPKEV